MVVLVEEGQAQFHSINESHKIISYKNGMKFETPWCVIGGGEFDGYLSCIVNRDKGGIVVKEIDDGRRVCGDRSALDIGRLRKRIVIVRVFWELWNHMKFEKRKVEEMTVRLSLREKITIYIYIQDWHEEKKNYSNH